MALTPSTLTLLMLNLVWAEVITPFCVGRSRNLFTNPVDSEGTSRLRQERRSQYLSVSMAHWGSIHRSVLWDSISLITEF